MGSETHLQWVAAFQTSLWAAPHQDLTHQSFALWAWNWIPSLAKEYTKFRLGEDQLRIALVKAVQSKRPRRHLFSQNKRDLPKHMSVSCLKSSCSTREAWRAKHKCYKCRFQSFVWIKGLAAHQETLVPSASAASFLEQFQMASLDSWHQSLASSETWQTMHFQSCTIKMLARRGDTELSSISSSEIKPGTGSNSKHWNMKYWNTSWREKAMLLGRRS